MADGAEWLRRWDRQQEGYLADREARFAVILDVVAATCGGRPPVVLDLAAGPGSLAARVLERFPDATVVAVDNDPVLMLLGRRAYGADRLQWAQADLRDATWPDAVAGIASFDAVVSTTALHWLDTATLRQAYASAVSLLRPGGVVVNGDHMVDEQPRLAALQRTVHPDGGDFEEWRPWWDALETAAEHDPELAAAFAERAARDAGHPESDDQPWLGEHVAAMRAAGCSEVGTVWQRGDDRVLVGLTPSEGPGAGATG